MKLPQLYMLGQNSYYFNLRTFFAWVLTGIWHSLVCFFVSYLSLSTAQFYYGIPGDYTNLNYMVYTNIIFVVTLKVGIESSSWTIVHHLSFIGSILSWFFIVVLYASIWPAISIIIPAQSPTGIVDIRYTMRAAYLEFFNASGNSVYWLSLMLAIVLALSRDILWKAIVHNVTFGKFLRQVYHVVQNMEHAGLEVNEETVGANTTRLYELQPPVRKLPEGKYLSGNVQLLSDIEQSYEESWQLEEHTGYSFSQT